MAFTVKDFEDLVRIIEEHPEWRARMRQLVLTQDLLELPDLVRRLAEAQERAYTEFVEYRRITDQRIAELTRAVERLSAEFAEYRHATDQRIAELTLAIERLSAEFAEYRRTTDQRIAELAEAQRRTEQQVAELTQVVGQLSAEFAEYRRTTDQRIAELAEAQRRTEQQVAELTQVVGQLSAEFAEYRRTTDQRIAELAEAQRRTEQQVAELAEAQRRTEQQVAELAEAQRRTEQQVAELAEAQRRTEQQVAGLTAAQQHTEQQVASLAAQVAELAAMMREVVQRLERLENWQRGEAGRRDGERFERHTVARAPFLFYGGSGGGMGEPHVREQVGKWMAPLYRQGIDIDDDEDPLLADLIWWKGDRVMVAEISIKIDAQDVRRAAARARTLQQAGVNATPIVIGREWATPNTQALAQEEGVEWMVSGGLSRGLLEFRQIGNGMEAAE